MTQKKIYRGQPIADSRKQFIKTDSLQIFDNSIIVRQQQRNENFNSSLISNFNQLRELIRERKNLLKAKHESMLAKNREKLNSISQARDYDLRNQAKMLNDRSIIQLVDHSQSLSRSKSLVAQLCEIKSMSNYEAGQRNAGKQFWDKHKQFQREKKKKAQWYASHARQLQELNQRQRIIFTQIEKQQNQIKTILTKDRDDPDHVTRAELLNEQIEKKKAALRDIKAQKSKIKGIIQNIIDDILQFNNSYEKVYKQRSKELDDVFAGTQDITHFDTLMGVLEKIVSNKLAGGLRPEHSAVNLPEYLRNYDILLQNMEKMKEEQDLIFNNINEDLRDRLKTAIMEKSYLIGMPNKVDPGELAKKLKDYRRLLLDFGQQRPRIEREIAKMNQMNNALYPIKKGYETEDVRREDLKRDLKRLLSLNADLEAKQKEQRNFYFNMQQLQHRRKAIEIEINDLAEKVNLGEYKNKMRELEELNRRIGQKSDVALQSEIANMRAQLEDSYNRLYDNYEYLISEVEIQGQDNTLGVFLTKLEKRLSLI